MDATPITRALNYTVGTNSFVDSRSTMKQSQRRSNNLDPNTNIASTDEPEIIDTSPDLATFTRDEQSIHQSSVAVRTASATKVDRNTDDYNTAVPQFQDSESMSTLSERSDLDENEIERIRAQ